MSTSIVILSPLPLDRLEKAVARCQARIEELGVEGPEMLALEEHPMPESLEALLAEEDEEIVAQAAKMESYLLLASDRSFSADPVFVESFLFLLRRAGEALVQFPEGVAELEIAMMVVANLTGIEQFDEREEARIMHARLLCTKYRLLKKFWMTGSEEWVPRLARSQDIEQYEKSNRFRFSGEYRGYLSIVGLGPGPVGLIPIDEMPKAKTYAKAKGRPRLGKAVVIGSISDDHHHLLINDGDYEGFIWEVHAGELAPEPLATSFLEYIESWIGEGEPEPLLCATCGVPLEVRDLEKEYCQGCGARRVAEERSEASQAFEALAKALLLRLIETELLEIEEPSLLPPLIAGLTEYMSEKGHKWKSPDRAAASIAGWLIHRDEVAELHGSNSDVARVFEAVGRG